MEPAVVNDDVTFFLGEGGFKEYIENKKKVVVCFSHFLKIVSFLLFFYIYL